MTLLTHQEITMNQMFRLLTKNKGIAQTKEREKNPELSSRKEKLFVRKLLVTACLQKVRMQ